MIFPFMNICGVVWAEFPSWLLGNKGEQESDRFRTNTGCLH